MAGSVKGLVVQIGGDTSKLQESLKKVNSEVKNLSKDLKSVNSLTSFDNSSIEMYIQKQGLVKDQTEALKNKLSQLTEIQKQADIAMYNGADISIENYRALEREIEATRQQLEQLNTENSIFYKLGNQFENFGNSIKNISEKISSLGTSLTTTVTVPIAGLATIAVKSATDFESAWTGVLKTVDGTEQQLERLRSGIIALSEEIPSSAAEIANVAEIAGQLGIATDDVLNFTKVMIDLGNSTNLSAEEAATSLAKFANITNMSASDYQRLGSTIVDLGNNFATTEAEIVEMTTRLAATGELAGLSQSQMLALATSMSSVGIEAEAGGTAMSKLLQKLQVVVETGSESLGDFAKVAGMSSKEFKKAWEEDALNATYKFISGLKDTERNGKSAIAILQDMEIKEARLSNTILSLANSSEMFGKSIELANNAWENNTALTDEANKRYATFQSKLDTTKNKAQNLAVEFGEKLMPHIDKLLDYLSNLVKWFGNLSDEEQTNILKTAALVAAIGPALTIVGKLGSAFGTTLTVIGKLSTGMANLPAVINGVTTSLGSVPGALTAITATIATAYIAMDSFYNYLKSVLNEADANELSIFEKSTNSTIQLTNKFNELTNATKENAESTLSEIENYSRLKEELDTIVDQNGKVKKGYEARASFISNELKKATGVEIEIIDNTIKKYDELTKKIEDSINQKRLEIIMSAQEEQYKTAIQNIDELRKNAQEALTNWALADPIDKNKLEELKKVAVESQKAYEVALENIASYERNAELVMEHGADALEEIQKRTAYNISTSATGSASSISNSLKLVEMDINYYKEKFAQAGDSMYSTQQEKSEKMLKSIIDTLVETTSTIDEMTEEQKEAWTQLATSSYEGYAYGLSNMSEETATKIQETIGIFVQSTPEFQKIAEELSNNIVNGFENSEEVRKKATETLQSYINGLNDNEKRELLKVAGIEDVNLVLKELDKGNLSEENGKRILDGLQRGLTDTSKQNTLIARAASLASSINKVFTSIWDIHSPSKYMQKLMNYYLEPIGTTFDKQEFSLTNKAKKFASSINDSMQDGLEMFNNDGLSASLNAELIQPNKYYNIEMTINPQKLTDAELNNAFNFVNKKLGMIGG